MNLEKSNSEGALKLKIRKKYAIKKSQIHENSHFIHKVIHTIHINSLTGTYLIIQFCITQNVKCK